MYEVIRMKQKNSQNKKGGGLHDAVEIEAVSDKQRKFALDMRRKEYERLEESINDTESKAERIEKVTGDRADNLRDSIEEKQKDVEYLKEISDADILIQIGKGLTDVRHLRKEDQ